VSAAEQRVQQHDLGVAGVLVLVQQHDLETVALDHADLGVIACHQSGPRHLVAEVHRLDVQLALLVQPDERQERQPVLLPQQHLLDVLVDPAG
jgi:hypothetical protein